MIIEVQFIDGHQDGREWSHNFERIDGKKEYQSSAGCHIGGSYDHPVWHWVRCSRITIVRQHDLWRTVRVLVHELAHAAIWILRLPRSWSTRLDRGEPAIEADNG